MQFKKEVEGNYILLRSHCKQNQLQQACQPDEQGFKLCGLGYEKTTLSLSKGTEVIVSM